MKAHGHNRISIRILKICGPSICKPLEFILKSCLEIDIIPLEWKKGHIVLAHPNKKKQQYLTNYRPMQPFLLYIKMFVLFSFPQISQVLNLQTLASSSSYQLPMEHMISLIRDLKFEMCFLTYLS